MSKDIRGNQRHMTLEDRIYIEKCLDKNMAFKDIAKFLCKDPSTISKEVKKHRIHKPRNSFNSINNCGHRHHCNLKNICSKPACKKRCASCSLCNKLCGKFVPEVCLKLDHASFVCNGCEKKFPCKLDKYYYRASSAHNDYLYTRSSSREGINLSEADLAEIDDLVTPLVRNGQSIAHIYAHHKEDIPFTSRTLYNYVENSVLSVRNIDLPRKVKYKPRCKHNQLPRKEHSWMEGRKYSDFTSYVERHPETSVVEMDTVEGLKGGKALLTMLFRNSKCMLAFLLPDKTQESVLKVFSHLEQALGTIVFQKTFPVILTDNGSEFINPILLETGIDNLIRTRIFYCDSNASYQKGALEKNHEFIRYIVPRGKSFNHFDQGNVTLMVNHINSTARASLNGRTPFELASLLLDDCFIKTVCLEKIEPDNICLKPSLLKK